MDLRIVGMHCGGCVAAVEKALRGAPGVIEATVNLATETAAVRCDASVSRMDGLLMAVRAAGYDAVPARRAGAETAIDTQQADRLREHRQALVVALGMGLPVIALDYLSGWLVSGHPGGHIWPAAVEALVVLLLLLSPAAAPILVSGLRSLLRGSPNMDLLIGLGVTVAFAGSVVALLLPHTAGAGAHAVHFHAAAMILIFINVGRYLEARARGRATDAVGALAARAPRTAQRVTNGRTETVRVEELGIGDRVRIGPETSVPADGIIEEGSAAIDESMLTGEAVPADREVGERVFGGTMVRSGLITVRVTARGSESAVARILEAVQRAQSGRTRMQRIADRAASVFVPIVVVLAALTWLGWAFSGSEGAAHRGFLAAVAVLVVACPCAMGLATPVAVLVATGNAALRGILVRDAAALEAAGRVNVVAFDKTGTLTTGRMRVTHVVEDHVSAVTRDAKDLLRLAAAAELHSQHPLARAIVEKAREWGLTLPEPTRVENLTGLGVRADVDGGAMLIGSPKLMSERGISLEAIRHDFERRTQAGETVILVAREGRAAGLIALADTLRSGASQAVGRLQRMGVESALLSGDHHRAAAAVGSAAGIAQIHAGLTPEGKAEHVRGMRRSGRRVGFVGDGTNDAPALATADVGISFASGTDVANQTADICLISDNLALVPEAVALARRSVRIIRQNLFWAFVYNLAMLPLAAVGWVRPEWAAAAMMLSSISVVLNSLRLREGVAVVGRGGGGG